jgi:ABC-type enterochelin transport system permease subunit
VYVAFGADNDLRQVGRQVDIALTAGERLLVIVGMSQDSFGQQVAIQVNHLPGIGVMIPALVVVTNGDVKPSAASVILAGLHKQYLGKVQIGIAGQVGQRFGWGFGRLQRRRG